MLLHLSTWPEIEQRLARSTAIVIPIGSNEQHGPTGLLGTDWLCPEIIAHEAHDEGDILVGPTFNIGMAQHHLGFPGTITLKPSTMIAVMKDWTASLTRHGFRQIYFLNGHGGNIPTIQAAFSEIYAEASFQGTPRGFILRLRNWWDLPGVSSLCSQLFPAGHGTHATPSEIAVTQYAYPKSIKTAAYAPKTAPTGPIREGVDFRDRYPDGRMGSDPALATPEAGARIVRLASEGLASDVRSFQAEAPFGT